MKVKVIPNHWLPKYLNVKAITLYPRIYLAIDCETAVKQNMIAHEFIHVRQIREQGWIRFYVKYLWDYVKQYRTYKNWDEAYYHIPAEVEAYANQNTTPIPANVKYVGNSLEEV